MQKSPLQQSAEALNLASEELQKALMAALPNDQAAVASFMNALKDNELEQIMSPTQNTEASRSAMKLKTQDALGALFQNNPAATPLSSLDDYLAKQDTYMNVVTSLAATKGEANKSQALSSLGERFPAASTKTMELDGIIHRKAKPTAVEPSAEVKQSEGLEALTIPEPIFETVPLFQREEPAADDEEDIELGGKAGESNGEAPGIDKLDEESPLTKLLKGEIKSIKNERGETLSYNPKTNEVSSNSPGALKDFCQAKGYTEFSFTQGRADAIIPAMQELVDAGIHCDTSKLSKLTQYQLSKNPAFQKLQEKNEALLVARQEKESTLISDLSKDDQQVVLNRHDREGDREKLAAKNEKAYLANTTVALKDEKDPTKGFDVQENETAKNCKSAAPKLTPKNPEEKMEAAKSTRNEALSELKDTLMGSGSPQEKIQAIMTFVASMSLANEANKPFPEAQAPSWIQHSQQVLSSDKSDQDKATYYASQEPGIQKGMLNGDPKPTPEVKAAIIQELSKEAANLPTGDQTELGQMARTLEQSVQQKVNAVMEGVSPEEANQIAQKLAQGDPSPEKTKALDLVQNNLEQKVPSPIPGAQPVMAPEALPNAPPQPAPSDTIQEAQDNDQEEQQQVKADAGRPSPTPGSQKKEDKDEDEEEQYKGQPPSQTSQRGGDGSSANSDNRNQPNNNQQQQQQQQQQAAGQPGANSTANTTGNPYQQAINTVKNAKQADQRQQLDAQLPQGQSPQSLQPGQR